MNKGIFMACATVLLSGMLPGHVMAGAENKCKVCHDFTKGVNKVGPSLKGVLGRKAGTFPGYHYKFKFYIKGKPWVWTEEKIRQWDFNTAEAVKKFTGNPKASTRMPSQFMTGTPEDEIIAYIRKTSGKPAAGEGSGKQAVTANKGSNAPAAKPVPKAHADK